jgi:PhnB protein
MTEHLEHVRHGFGSVRPYVHGHLELWDLVRDAFDAVEIERHEFGPKSFHVEARIGDSVIVLELGDPPSPSGAPGSIYVYVPDVDVAYRRALERGASSIAAPENKPYEERTAGVRDSFGNTWWISTYRGSVDPR